jgi:ribosomal protein S6--L-glutamate ligase
MRIGIIGSASGWYWEDLKRAAATLTAERMELVPLPFSSLRAGMEGVRHQMRSQNERLETLDGALVRSMPPGSLEQVIFRMDVLHELGHQGCRVINAPRALETAIDKYLSLARLQSAGFSVPATIVTQSADEAMEAFDDLGGDVVVKPIFGSEGRGMIRLTEPEIARRVFGSLVQINAVLYVQKYLPNAGADWRLLTIGSQVLGIRRICQNNWRANLAQGATAEPLLVCDELAHDALRAARAIGAEIAAVDFLPADDGTTYILEVNAVPGWRGLARTLDVDVARLILMHMVRLVKSTAPNRKTWIAT